MRCATRYNKRHEMRNGLKLLSDVIRGNYFGDKSVDVVKVKKVVSVDCSRSDTGLDEHHYEISLFMKTRNSLTS
jgi:hypothetical protein